MCQLMPKRKRRADRQAWTMHAWADGDDADEGTDFLATPGGKPSARSDKMWCAESDFEPRIRKIASYVTPHACSDLDNVGTHGGGGDSASQGPT